jgi:uncharacterized membrane protein YqhA
MASITVLLYGAGQTISTIVQVLREATATSTGSKTLIVSFVEVIDLFLLATVFYITALGLYELFIDENIKVPEWLQIHSIDDLKEKLTSVVIVLLSVLFLGQVVKWDGNANILPFGVSIALVIGTLTYFLSERYKRAK